MKIVVTGADERIAELKNTASEINFVKMDYANWQDEKGAGAFFNLCDDAIDLHYDNLSAPLFINSVITTLAERKITGNVVRFNGWPGFISRPILEVAGTVTSDHRRVCESLGKKLIILPDEPGFVSGRVVSMIINEAFFAKDDGVSEEEEIDIAMKLGTNYPFGPFEWGSAIGITNVAMLLTRLAKDDRRYAPCRLLLKTAEGR